MTTKKSKSTKKSIVKKVPMRTKSSSKLLQNAENAGRWSNEEDELLLHTNSNLVAALLLKRSRDSAANRRFVLRTKFGKESVPVETIGLKKARSIVAKILKQKKTENNTMEFILPNNTVKTLPYSTTEKIEPIKENNVEIMMPIMLVVNGQEMLFKNGLKKLVIQGDNILFSVE
jgi:hypothetical protein